MTSCDLARLQLASRHWEQVLREVARHLPEAEIWAYGSRVTGTSQEASDLDLVVRNPRDLEEVQTGVAALKEALVESDLPIRVDVVDWARLPDSFRREIERGGYVVVRK